MERSLRIKGIKDVALSLMYYHMKSHCNLHADHRLVRMTVNLEVSFVCLCKVCRRCGVGEDMPSAAIAQSIQNSLALRTQLSIAKLLNAASENTCDKCLPPA